MRAMHPIVGLSSLAVVLLLIGKPTGATAAETLSAIKSEGITELTCKTPNGNTVQVEISQAKLDLSSFPYRDALFWGGDVDELPQTVLTSIHITQNRKALFVPLSVYSDLGDVKFASVEPTKAGFTLHVHGGGTATGYDATVSFSQGFLKTRTVRNREFPNESWEKTQYSFAMGIN
jgi:hypothetical protein